MKADRLTVIIFMLAMLVSCDYLPDGSNKEESPESVKTMFEDISRHVYAKGIKLYYQDMEHEEWLRNTADFQYDSKGRIAAIKQTFNPKEDINSDGIVNDKDHAELYTLYTYYRDLNGDWQITEDDVPDDDTHYDGIIICKCMSGYSGSFENIEDMDQVNYIIAPSGLMELQKDSQSGTFEYEYDGLRLNQVTNTYNNISFWSNYLWDEGNIVKVISGRTENTAEDYATHHLTYYDLKNPFRNSYFDPLAFSCYEEFSLIPLGFCGTHNENLIETSSYVTMYETQNYESQYTYEFNDSGLPVKVIKTSSRSAVMTIEITY